MFLAYVTAHLISLANNAFYDRRGLESVAAAKFADATFDDVMQDELLITSVEFNEYEPRFYSKYFRAHDEGQ